jgi:FdhD protein
MQNLVATSSNVAIRRLKAGALVDANDDVIEEVPVAFEYNGISHAVMLASPQDLEEFALGFTLSEGICKSIDECYDIEVTPSTDGVTLQIQISSEAFIKLKERRRNLTGRTGCGLCGTESLCQVLRPLPHNGASSALTASGIRLALEALSAHQPLTHITGGAHAAAWCSADGKVVAVYEDVGRHNALDKLIGAISKRKIDVQSGFVLMTSRASVELVQKSATVRIPTLIAISAPTALAIETAQNCGMTLIAFARGSEFVVYANGKNIRLD